MDIHHTTDPKERAMIKDTIDQIVKIAEQLGEVCPKKHGAYMIVSDEKIEITLDTYAFNLTVQLKTDPAVFVLSIHLSTVTVWKDGKWHDYIINKYLPAAIDKIEKAEHAREAEKKAEHARKFAPVNDEKFFQ